MPEGVHSWHGNWILSEDNNIGLRSDHRCDLGIEDQSKIYLVLFDLWLITLCFDSGCSYLAQWLSVGSRSQQKFKITDMTLESKVKYI